MSVMLTRWRALSTAVFKVVNDVAKQQFVITSRNPQGEAILFYEKQGSKITFHRTEVPQQFQGKGVGKLLAQHAFDYAKQNNLEVVCKCQFLVHFYQKNSNKYRNVKVKIES